MTQRTHRTPEQWDRIYQDWLASGLSLPKYCKQANVPYQSLYNYNRRQSQANAAVQSSSPAEPAFIEVGSMASLDSGLMAPDTQLRDNIPDVERCRDDKESTKEVYA